MFRVRFHGRGGQGVVTTAELLGNRFGQGKFTPLIAMAHEIPYVATATVAALHDLEYKATRTMDFRGARYLHILVPCPPSAPRSSPGSRPPPTATSPSSG